ncbi:MAG: ATP12 family protein [Caulobacteraceae bacterium]
MTPRRDAPENPRRFYREVDVAAADAGFAARLDGRVPRSPSGRPLVLPTRALADLMAAEWADQGEVIVFAAMPATRLAQATLDSLAGAGEASVATVVRYAGADLLCYPAESPRVLAARQTALWSPLLAWAREEMGLAFVQSQGVVHRPQPPETLAKVAAIAGGMDDFALAGVAYATALFGSTILALALWRGRLEGAGAFAASRVDEAFQQEQWGADSEAVAREAAQGAEAAMLQAWFAALR